MPTEYKRHDHTCSFDCASTEEHMRAMEMDADLQVHEAEEYKGTLRWFGAAFDSPMYEGMPEVPTPVGEKCGLCRESILEGEPGVTMPGIVKDEGDEWVAIRMAIHIECQIRSIMGSPSHLDGTCSCHTGVNELGYTHPNTTYRQEAREVIARMWGSDWQASAVRSESRNLNPQEDA